jgi:predicted DNA-binding transcriptional regulator AlpA
LWSLSNIGKRLSFSICLSEKESFTRQVFEICMKNLLSIIQDERANIKLEMSGEDLLVFSNDLINRAKSELSVEIAEARKERYLTRQEVKEICGVCDATLWHWNKKGYLTTIKIGSKVRYRMSDVRQILEGGSSGK